MVHCVLFRTNYIPLNPVSIILRNGQDFEKPSRAYLFFPPVLFIASNIRNAHRPSGLEYCVIVTHLYTGLTVDSSLSGLKRECA